MAEKKRYRKAEDYPDRVRDVASSLGQRLLADFREREQARWPYEQRWLKDLRQVKGIYEPEVYAQLSRDERSRAFLRLTRSKAYTILARLMDLLFPANGDKNWEIEPTELPDIPDYLAQQAAQIVQGEIAQMAQADPEAMQGFDQDARLWQVAKELAKQASTLMGEEMEDQLSDGRQKYRATIRKVVRSALWYGSGFLKGPMVDSKTIKRWGQAPQVDEASGQTFQAWGIQEQQVDRPYFDAPSIWNVYPDMSVAELHDGTGIFERHVVTRHELSMVIAKQPRFDSAKIREYVAAIPDGDYESKDFEDALLNLADERESEGYTAPKGKRRYELIEYWGFVSGAELAESGIETGEDAMADEYRANVWMLGPVVVKAVLHPFDGIDLPYYAFYFDKDESSVFGEGVPSTMRDIQSLFNAAIRAAADNAAMASGPVGECNIDLLEPGEIDTADQIRPRRIFLRKGRGADAQFPAYRFFTIPSNVSEFMAFAQFIQEYGDETTNIPRFLQGESNGVKGAGKTASGLSMLMGAANISLSDLVKGFDDGITIPFITALYQWNMQFNPREDIKGDMLVKARGSTALMAKEQRTQAINNVLMASNNQTDVPYIKRGDLWRDLVVAMDLPADRARTDDEVQELQAQQQAPIEQALQQVVAQVQQLAQGQQMQEQAMAQAVGQISQQMQALAQALANTQNQPQG